MEKIWVARNSSGDIQLKNISNNYWGKKYAQIMSIPEKRVYRTEASKYHMRDQFSRAKRVLDEEREQL